MGSRDSYKQEYYFKFDFLGGYEGDRKIFWLSTGVSYRHENVNIICKFEEALIKNSAPVMWHSYLRFIVFNI